MLLPQIVDISVKNTGAERWKMSRDEVSTWSEPFVVDYKGSKQVILSGTKKVRSYDLNTGKIIWECGGLGTNPIPTSLRQDDIVIFGPDAPNCINLLAWELQHGGGSRTNYDSVSLALCERELEKAGLPPNVVVDCSHGNSNKDPGLQPLVAENLGNQILEGNRSIVGFMLESNLHWGSQPVSAKREELKYGVSVTDACIDWETTEGLLLSLDQRLRSAPRFAKGSAAA